MTDRERWGLLLMLIALMVNAYVAAALLFGEPKPPEIVYVEKPRDERVDALKEAARYAQTEFCASNPKLPEAPPALEQLMKSVIEQNKSPEAQYALMPIILYFAALKQRVEKINARREELKCDAT